MFEEHSTAVNLSKSTSTCLHGATVPRNNDSILVVLKLEGERVLLCVVSGGNACAGLRLFNVLHELKIHV